jgi:5-methylcytosine-specific restriction endonuclease McrA
VVIFNRYFNQQIMTKTPRIKIPDSVRDYVFQRDRYQCQSCGRQQGEVILQVDHIISLAQGGSNDLSNLQTLCQACNRRKGSNHDSRFRRHFT